MNISVMLFFQVRTKVYPYIYITKKHFLFSYKIISMDKLYKLKHDKTLYHVVQLNVLINGTYK